MSAPSSGYIRLTAASAAYFDIPLPNYPYSIRIDFPWEIQELESGTFKSKDFGNAYDKRSSEFSFDLTATVMSNLKTFLMTTARAQAYTLELASDSGIYPFGADKGNIGPFSVSVKIDETQGMGPNPYQYFNAKLRIQNVGVYPAFTLPTEISDGALTIGTVSGIRFPIDWFDSKVTDRYDIVHTENSSAYFSDRLSSGDYFRTQAKFILNTSKAAALLYYLSATARTSTFNLIVGSNVYPFGREKGDNKTFVVQNISTYLEIKHIQHNRFEIPLSLAWVS